MAPQPLDEIGATDDHTGLRTAEELVAGEAHEIGSRAKALGRCRLVAHLRERARAEVVHQGQLVRARDRRELRELRLLREADDAEVRLVHAQEHRRLGPDRALVVGGARAVRRPDLDEARARAREHIRDAEAVADLDQLAARDDDLAALRERGEREQDGRGVVVDDERGFGTREPPQERPRGDPGASPARLASRSYSRFE